MATLVELEPSRFANAGFLLHISLFTAIGNFTPSCLAFSGNWQLEDYLVARFLVARFLVAHFTVCLPLSLLICSFTLSPLAFADSVNAGVTLPKAANSLPAGVDTLWKHERAQHVQAVSFYFSSSYRRTVSFAPSPITWPTASSPALYKQRKALAQGQQQQQYSSSTSAGAAAQAHLSSGMSHADRQNKHSRDWLGNAMPAGGGMSPSSGGGGSDDLQHDLNHISSKLQAIHLILQDQPPSHPSNPKASSHPSNPAGPASKPSI
eukprot:gene2426-8746_t